MRWKYFFICSVWLVVTSGQGQGGIEDLTPTEDPSIPDLPITLEDSTTTEESSTPETSTTLEESTTTEANIPDSSTPEISTTLEESTTTEVTTLDPSITTEAPSTVEEPSTTEEPTTIQPIVTAEPIELDPNVPIVIIPQGVLVGSVAFDGDYFEFNGIPYADSTAGEHRFKAPMPPLSFEEMFIANRKDIKCVRPLGIGYEGTEDCLVANVFTPTLDITKELPVMVWIKGKEFDKVYENELSFKNFMEKEVVVVSLNYRESILGFLCLGTETAPGNAGLKDIIAGLHWVKENIRQFGGNPNDITLFGHGSGAAAVDLVTLSPMAEGLVNKAISQSGNALAPWAVSRDNLEYAVKVAEALGHVITNVEELSRVFERTSLAALMGVINELDLTENSLAFAPCLEREDLESVQPFLVKTPSEIILSGQFLQIPFITGFVDNEGTIRSEEALEDGWLERMDESFHDFLQSDLKFEDDDERLTAAQRIREFYFEEDPIDFSTFGDYIAYHGETMMLVSSIREARLRVQATSAPTYLYQFSYKGALGEPFVGPVEVETAAHSEELAYMFHGSTEGVPDRDLLIGEILVERWTNFAKTGFPSSEISQVIWQPYTTDNSYYLRVLAADEIASMEDATLEIVLVDPHPETIFFWDDIYNNYFLDAESNWSLNEREEDDESVEGSGEEEEEEDDEDEENDGNSASTSVGYTFLIVTLFTLLNKFHASQLVS